MYNERVMKEFAEPKNVGFIEDADGVGKVGNAACGDIMEISLKIDNDIITDAKFRTFGCAAAIASSSVATQMVIGKTLDEALNIKNRDVVETLQGLPPQKIHCSVLAEEAIKKAVEDYQERKNKQ
ncbi:MAG: Fe-S cluster assembly scaffold protein NifU [Clostridia bacterium]|nr:Fe-S cluster assembly scaffold protein NifU [Clostridia bacterium]